MSKSNGRGRASDGSNGRGPRGRTYADAVAEFVMAVEALKDAFIGEVKKALEAIQPVIEEYRRLYREAGAPYGYTDEGMWAWLTERMEAENDDEAQEA